MKTRKTIALLLALTLLLSLTGCGPMTVEKLEKKMAKAMEGRSVTEMAMAMEMEMQVGVMGITLDMAMEMEGTLKMSDDLTYDETTVKVTALGSETVVHTQSYTLEEDGVRVTYTHSDEEDSWIRKEAVQNGLDLPVWENLSLLTLAEETENVDGREAYVLTGEIPGALLEAVLGDEALMDNMVGSIGADLSELDPSALTVTAKAWVDAKTFLPLRMDMEIDGMAAMMDGMMATLTENAGVELEVEVEPVLLTVSGISFDPVEVPELPAEAAE